MENKEKKLWFRRKRYGWGWTPVTYEGWVVIGIYVLILAALFRYSDIYSHSASDTLINFAPVYLGLTILLIVVCYLKGEKPKWTWGGK